MAHGSFPIEGESVVLTDAIANRLGFINLAAMKEWELRRETNTVEKMLVDICNMKQMILDTKTHVERVDARLTSTGTEKIG